MEIHKLDHLLRGNRYPGRGIVLGRSRNGSSAVCAYFIMGRSVNSRNRIFVRTEDGIRTEAYDPSLMTDPSLIIYAPVRKLGDSLIVSNGDQTDTIVEYMGRYLRFERALEDRCFEPDAPNYTPRISGLLELDRELGYRLSILKSSDGKGNGCNRFTYAYDPLDGVGHLLHTYQQDGDPLPSYSGEPKPVEIPDDIDSFADLIWNSLDEENKISLYVSYTDLDGGDSRTRIFNKHQQGSGAE